MRQSKSQTRRLWPLLAVNFFMADMQSGIAALRVALRAAVKQY
jgi:hypothetical protein